MEEATGRIRIICVPDGDAPEEVRTAWKGLTLPAYPKILEGGGRGGVSGVFSGEADSFEVPQDAALRVLGEKDPVAACYWISLGFPQKGHSFFFKTTCADVIGESVKKRKKPKTT